MPSYSVLICLLLCPQIFSQFIPDIEEIHAKAGSTVQLLCVGETLNAAAAWYRCSDSDHCDQLFVTATGIVKQPGSSNRITVRSSKYKRITFHLIITDVRPRDEGLYQCVIYNLQKIETTRTVRLKVKLAQQATLTTAEVRQTTVLLETATSDSLRNPPSLALAVPVTIACVGFIFLGPVLCLFLKYSRLKQRIHTQFDAHQVASNSHLYEEISPRFNAYIIQDISPGPEFDDGYETVGYEVLRRETQLLSDLYYTCHQV